MIARLLRHFLSENHRGGVRHRIYGTEEKTTPPEYGTRIDFILASPALTRAAKDAQVVRAGVVNRTSDHYPVVVDFARAVER